MRASTTVGVVTLAVGFTACRYSDLGVGKSEAITAEQARAYEESQGGFVPAPIDEHVGTGPAVQPDRMVTADLTFSKADGSRVAEGRIRFVHSASSTGPYLFGYASPVIVGAMAGMREGGRRRVWITDSSCQDTSSAARPGIPPRECYALGNRYEAATSGGFSYPRATPLLADIVIVRVCRPTVIEERLPNLMGGGPGRKIRETSCR